MMSTVRSLETNWDFILFIVRRAVGGLSSVKKPQYPTPANQTCISVEPDLYSGAQASDLLSSPRSQQWGRECAGHRSLYEWKGGPCPSPGLGLGLGPGPGSGPSPSPGSFPGPVPGTDPSAGPSAGGAMTRSHHFSCDQSQWPVTRCNPRSGMLSCSAVLYTLTNWVEIDQDRRASKRWDQLINHVPSTPDRPVHSPQSSLKSLPSSFQFPGNPGRPDRVIDTVSGVIGLTHSNISLIIETWNYELDNFIHFSEAATMGQ